MDSAVEMFRDGGPFMYLLLLLVLGGLFVQLLVPMVGMARLRVPGVLSLVVPCLVVLVGLAATGLGFQQVWAAVGYASVEMRPPLTAMGTAVALYTLIAGQLGSALLASVAAGVSGLAVLVDGVQSRETGQWSFYGLLLCALGLPLVGVLAWLGGPFWVLWGLAGLASLALASLRSDEDPEIAARLGAGKLRVAALVMSAGVAFTMADALNARIGQLSAIGRASSEMRSVLMALHGGELFGAYLTGALGVVMFAVLGLAIAAPQLRHLASPRSAVGALLIGFVLVFLAASGIGLDLYAAGVQAEIVGMLQQ